jgi:methylglyoxal synthase
MTNTKNIALVAHDNKKQDLVEWVEYNYWILLQHNLFCTGTTGTLIEDAMKNHVKKFNPEISSLKNVHRFKSGPLGGDQQIGAFISEGKIEILIFFWDPLSMQPHDPDIKALLRLAVLYNIPIACDRSTADFIITSPLLHTEYKKKEYDYSDYLNRFSPKH